MSASGSNVGPLAIVVYNPATTPTAPNEESARVPVNTIPWGELRTKNRNDKLKGVIPEGESSKRVDSESGGEDVGDIILKELERDHEPSKTVDLKIHSFTGEPLEEGEIGHDLTEAQLTDLFEMENVNLSEAEVPSINVDVSEIVGVDGIDFVKSGIDTEKYVREHGSAFSPIDERMLGKCEQIFNKDWRTLTQLMRICVIQQRKNEDMQKSKLNM
ncbi:hypothetical protein Hanom_Chr03g00191391 [Helianthus anomalus]